MEKVQQQIQGTEHRERRESLQALYGYLETRYQEQVKLLSQVDTSIKTRLAVLSAALGIITFLAAGIWRIPGMANWEVAHFLVLCSLVPVFVSFTKVFFCAMNILERQLYTPGFSLQDTVALAEYKQIMPNAVYECFVKNLAMTIDKNENMFAVRVSLENKFRRWNKGVVLSLFCPFIVFLILYILPLF